MHLPTTDTIILIIVAVFAAFCFWKWIKCKAEAKACRRVSALLMKEVSYFSEKARHDGPKILTEDPAPNKALQARIEQAPDSARNSMTHEKAAESNEPLVNAQIAWTRQDRYRLKMERNGFVRVVDERGRTRYTKVEKTAWIKSTKQWIRVSRDSKLFKEASFFFPGDYEKPTKNNYWQLLNRVHQDIEKAEGSGK